MSNLDETETQVESIIFVDKYCPLHRAIHSASELEEQARFLEREGEMQEAREVAFCQGMLAGGAIALTVLAVTLWLVGVL